MKPRLQPRNCPRPQDPPSADHPGHAVLGAPPRSADGRGIRTRTSGKGL